MMHKALARLCLSAVLSGGKSSRLVELAVPFSVHGFATSTSDAATTPKDKAQVWVGNLPFRAQAREVKERFSAYGVGRVMMLRDKVTKHSKGMALVVVDADKCEKAIAEINGTDFQGRILKVAMSTVPVPLPRQVLEVQAAVPTTSPEAAPAAGTARAEGAAPVAAPAAGTARAEGAVPVAALQTDKATEKAAAKPAEPQELSTLPLRSELPEKQQPAEPAASASSA